MPRLRFPDRALVLRMVEQCAKDGRPLMLAHDQGVYLCCDGLRLPNGSCECAYAQGCDPQNDPEWFDTARTLVGGDDFGMRFDLGKGEVLLAALRRGDRLVIGFNKRFVNLFTEGPKRPITTPPASGRGGESTPTARDRSDDMAATKTKKRSRSDQRSIDATIRKGMKEARETVAKNLAAIAAKESGKGAKAKAPKQPKEKKPKRVSCLDAAATLLAGAKEAMNCSDMIKVMAERKLWTSPNGATPEQTLHAAIGREIRAKGKASRFARGTDRGTFLATSSAGKGA